MGPMRIAIIFSLFLSLCVPIRAETGVTDTEIVIGSCSALTGNSKVRSGRQIQGARAYLNKINDGGGVQGRKIRLVEGDDRAEAEGAVECFKKTLLDGGAFAGAFFSGYVPAAKHVAMAQVNKIPVTGWLTGAQVVYDPFKRYVVSVRASYFDETSAQIEGLWRAGIHKIGVVYQADAFGATGLEGIKRALAVHGSAPVAFNSFPRNSVDIEAGYDQVELSEPEAVVIVGPAKPAAAIVKHGREKGRKTVFLAVSSVDTEEFIKEAGKDAEGTIISQVVPPFGTKGLPAVEQFVKNMGKYYPKEELSYSGLEGFINAIVLVEGLKRAGKDLTREKYVSAVESIQNLDIGLGPQFHLNYRADDHKGLHFAPISIIHDGKAAIFTDWASLKKNP